MIQRKATLRGYLDTPPNFVGYHKETETCSGNPGMVCRTESSNNRNKWRRVSATRRHSNSKEKTVSPQRLLALVSQCR